MDKCPYCESTWGVYTTITGRQFYDWDGEPAGYDIDDEKIYFARCRKCNRKISFKKLEESNKNKNE